MSDDPTTVEACKHARILAIGIADCMVQCLSLVFSGHADLVAVASTEQGLKRFAGEPFDIVLTNLGYEGSAGHLDREGFALIPRLHRIHRHVPVAIITGAGDCPQLVQEARRVGAFKVFFTPFAMDEQFLNTIRREIDSQRQSRSSRSSVHFV